MPKRFYSRASAQLDSHLCMYGMRTTFARELGVSAQNISDWATGFRRPALRWIVELNKRLGIPAGDWLISAPRIRQAHLHATRSRMQ